METSLDVDAMFVVIFEYDGFHEGGSREGGEDEHEAHSQDIDVPQVDIHGVGGPAELKV